MPTLRNPLALLCLTGTLLASSLAAEEARQVPLHGAAVARFAPVAEGAAVLRTRDRFLAELSRFDCQVRLQTDRDVTWRDVAEFAARQVLPWDEADAAKLEAVVAAARGKLQALQLPLPETVLLIKTTGKEEGNAAYCRGSAIVLPQRVVDYPPARLERTLLHELFHVLSSHNPQLRRELYAIVGFTLCPPVKMPAALADRKITNPDAPAWDAYIELAEDAGPQAAVPVLYASVEQFDPRRGGSFFQYLTFRLLAVRHDGEGWTPLERDGQPVLIDPRTAPSFHEQIGRNTKYVIHPDEILADNFVHLVAGTENLPSPAIVTALRAQLAPPSTP